MKEYIIFIMRLVRYSLKGSTLYYCWMGALLVLSFIGLYAYCVQFVDGLGTTGMTNQVSWGAYIANFTFLVGVAAAAVMLVIPAYIYKVKGLHDLAIFGEMLAISAVVMCLLFVLGDLGHVERFWHMIPPFGKFNFPRSMLSWDVIVLNGYLFLNMHICGYLLYKRYRKEEPTTWLYLPFVFIAIAWAISIHTVTAFLYVGLAGRPFWNHPIVAPRFLASAFAAGPAMIIITFQLIRSYTNYYIGDKPLFLLRNIITIALLINLFLLGCEVFTEFYSGTYHVASAQYLFLGLHGHNSLVPWIWTAIGMNIVAMILLLLPITRDLKWLNLACVLLIVGIWIEKGMGLIIPGFVPTPLGQIVEYLPTLNETLVCLGIWAFGILLFSCLLHIAIPIMHGDLHKK